MSKAPFPFRIPPMDHQRNALRKAFKKDAFGLFHGMGTGKTYTIINLSAARFMDGNIDALIVLCPSPIKLVWEDELKKYCPVKYDAHVLDTGRKARLTKFVNSGPTNGIMKVLIVGIEALSQGNAIKYVLEFAQKHDCMIACDESSRLKNATSTRTKNATKVSRRCRYKAIASGTPITQGIHDLYGQMNFLDPDIIGIHSWVTFRNTYCIMGGFEGRNIVGYRNTEELFEKIAPYVDIVRTEDVLDLPPKVHRQLRVDLTDEQLRIVEELGDMYEAQMEDLTLVASTALERLTRYQQVIGGHFPFVEGEDDVGRNIYGSKILTKGSPKLRALLDDIEDIPPDKKVVIWARFVPEIRMIVHALQQKYGTDAVADFYGGTEDFKESSAAFKTGAARFMVSNPAVGGMGQTWTVAEYEYGYSYSFSYEDWDQSGRRTWRKGQDKTVISTEIVANHKYDMMIFHAIKRKGGLAKHVNSALRETGNE